METKESITSETIADIVREMRGMLCRHDKDPLDIPPQNDILYIESLKCEFMQRYADRIEAAAKRSHCGCDDSCEQFRVLEREHERLRAKLEEECKRELDILNDRNALYDEYCRLRAALKPVLECDGTVGDSMYAVREAQRIARGGVANNEAR